EFFTDAFPALHLSVPVDLRRATIGRRSYTESFNPPILHRKELLLSAAHPQRAKLEKLTNDLQTLELLDGSFAIGFKRQWQEALSRAGYSVEDHTLVPIGNQTSHESESTPAFADSSLIARHLTALSRKYFSAPVGLLQRLGLLQGDHSLFDY